MRASHWAICALTLITFAGVASAEIGPPQKRITRPGQDAADFVIGSKPPAPRPPGARLAGLPDPYREDDNWAKMPAGRIWGASAGVGIDRDGKSVWFIDRCDKASCVGNPTVDPILKFDANGNLVKSFGKGMFHYPHGLWVDRNTGNIWVADGNSNPGPGKPKDDPKYIGNTVREFSPDGKLLMTLGTEGKIGKGPNLFSGVSSVVTAPNGDIYVADGHDADANDRIVKYDKNGKFLLAWGKAGMNPSAGEIGLPHGLAIDKEGRIYVADRFDKKVEVYDPNGKLLHVWDQFGLANGAFVDKNDILYVADNNWTVNTGFEVSGIRIATLDGKLIANIPFGEDNTMEDVAVADDGTVYGAFTNKPGAHRWFPTGPLKK